MSRLFRWGVLACLFPALTASAGEEAAKPIEEFHEVVQVDGARIGVMHTTVHRHDKEGKQLRAAAVLELSLKRYGAIVRLRKEEGSVETPEGKVLAVFMRQGQPGGRQLVLIGLVKDDTLHVKVDAGRIERRLSWNAGILGLRQQEQLFARKKPKPGDTLTFQRFEPTYNAVLTIRATVKERETVDVLGARKSLLRVEMTSDKLEVPGQSLQPPKVVWWLDDNFVPIRRQIELDGLGALLLTRTTRDKAQAAGAGQTTDIGARSLIALNRAIPRPYDTRSIVYRVTVRGEDNPGAILVSDAHQEVRNIKGNSFELHVHPVHPGSAGVSEKAAPEYLASCYYIDSDNLRVKELAVKAAGAETIAWKKALRIERWVKNAIRIDNSAALVPASQAAKTLRGDCRHHALLTAALCRSQGVPARTAIGLLYVTRGGPVLGFHMWTEVYVDGRWVGLDSTLGKGGVSAAHVKINDHGWNAVQSLTPLLPAARVLGKLRVEVLRIEK